MTNQFVQAWDIRAPIDQAQRCLELWLKEEKRDMPKRMRQRVAALLARYFQHEDEITDQLMISFLRHYSGWREIDMEDPTSVRMEIKTLLDKTVPAEDTPLKILISVSTAVALTVLVFCGWELSQMKLTPEQQMDLKTRVEKVVAKNADVTHAAVWSKIKKPMSVRRYQDISYWDYDAIVAMLETWPAAPEKMARH